MFRPASDGEVPMMACTRHAAIVVTPGAELGARNSGPIADRFPSVGMATRATVGFNSESGMEVIHELASRTIVAMALGSLRALLRALTRC